MDNSDITRDDLVAALDALCEEAGVSRRQLSIDAGMSDSAIKHIVRGSSRSPKADTLARLAAAASVPFTMFLGRHSLRAKIDFTNGPGQTIATAPVHFVNASAQVTQSAEETEWLMAWRDMNDSQRRRALAVLKAVINADAA
ncbi:helix-turn-helix transcriptional regulator [Asaia sp. BMEF1]|uniref:helix-turn-helix domain-containing protein n=1 Tax=Asaia sp. BMEF1 TaxID=3155932 RepID=UPI003F66527C